MGEAFITRRGGGAKKITFNDTPMVLTKTLPNALSVGRQKMAVASDEEYIAFTNGEDSSGNVVSNIDFFNRSGKHWTSSWPDALSDMGTAIIDNNLIGFGGRKPNNTFSNKIKRWHLTHALSNTGPLTTMADVSRGRCGVAVIPFSGTSLGIGGVFERETGEEGTLSEVCCHSLQSNTQVFSGGVGWGRAYSAALQCTSNSALVAGGLRLPQGEEPMVLSKVNLIKRDSNGDFIISEMPGLMMDQHHPTQATIYDQGKKYFLFGLGLTLAETEGIMLTPEQVVPTIDVYSVDSTEGSTMEVDPGKDRTLTLPLESNPLSAVALGFGDCVLYIVSYMQRVTKGYLVQLNPVRITTIEFNFRSYGLQGGVIGNDVGYLAGGIKNGEFSRDVLMIQLLRNVPIYPGMKYKLGSMASEETSNILTLHPLNDEIKLSGYMKL